MDKKIEKIKRDALAALTVLKDGEALEKLFNEVFGRKRGELSELLKGLKDLSVETKKTVGPMLNEAKKQLEEAFTAKREELWQKNYAASLETERLDITQPALPRAESGHLHPHTIVENDLCELFTSMGFMVLDGPELESDHYSFEGLNFSPDHPAREGYDTFYIKDHANWLMRPHTSPVQVRAMQKYGAPLRAVVPGRCFRNEATDDCHEHTFYQLEGLVVDRHISIANLISVMKELLQGVFKKEVAVRMRPGYFPFVEPGFELDMKCLVCGGDGCGACKHSGWIEVLPCGLVHPNVIKAGGLNPKEYQGFAFGLGLTRMVMQKYGIEDIRRLQSGDLKFLKQF